METFISRKGFHIRCVSSIFWENVETFLCSMFPHLFLKCGNISAIIVKGPAVWNTNVDGCTDNSVGYQYQISVYFKSVDRKTDHFDSKPGKG